MMKLRAIFFCLFLLMSSGCSGQGEQITESAAETGVELAEPSADPTPNFSNEKYVPDGHWRQVLNVYLPSEGEGPYPTILALHGGGFIARSKDHFAPYVSHFTDKGYAFVPANYRFAPADTYPAQVEDAFCALAWIHANASEFGFDTGRIFVMGDSAGGYLASMLGTVEMPEIYQGDCPYEVQHSIPPLGIVVLYGFFDLTNLDGINPDSVEASLEKFMGGSVNELQPEQLKEMSPMSWIDGGEPPFLVIHGLEDEVIASWVSENFANALKAAGGDASVLLVEDTHAFLLDRSSQTVLVSLEEIDGFMRNLVGP
jgi:acetyl esterase/lipase